MNTDTLQIGEASSLLLPKQSLIKHVVALGASGSGKTYLCKGIVEEAIRLGIPVIAIDPQGDLPSLGMSAGLPGEYWDKLDLKVWTPASEHGLPLSLQPNLELGMYKLYEDRVRALTAIGSELAALSGMMDEATKACFSKLVDYADRAGFIIDHMEDLCEILRDPPMPLAKELDPTCNEKERGKILKSLLIKMQGPRRLLLEMGMPINVDALFGYEPGGAKDNGKVRLSVICLNALSDDDKQLFIATLARAIYGWMIQDPKPYPVGMLYVDEVAPYVPPVSKPLAKDPLMLLLRQARKYGVSLLLATQSPGDLDYKGMGQIGTKLLGRMTTQQEMGKMSALFDPSDQFSSDELDMLPQLKQGQFIAICPDVTPAPTLFRSRQILSRHVTLSLEAMDQFVSLRDRVTYR